MIGHLVLYGDVWIPLGVIRGPALVPWKRCSDSKSRLGEHPDSLGKCLGPTLEDENRRYIIFNKSKVPFLYLTLPLR